MIFLDNLKDASLAKEFDEKIEFVSLSLERVVRLAAAGESMQLVYNELDGIDQSLRDVAESYDCILQKYDFRMRCYHRLVNRALATRITIEQFELCGGTK